MNKLRKYDKKIAYFSVFCSLLLSLDFLFSNKVAKPLCFAVFFLKLRVFVLRRRSTYKSLFFCVFFNCREFTRTTTYVVKP